MENKCQFLNHKNKNGKALLVDTATISKYPSLDFLKFSTFFKNKGYKVKYVQGEKIYNGHFDEIIISSLFSFDWFECIGRILHYKKYFPKSNISVGGIYPLIFPEHVFKHTGIWPYTGCIKEIDESPPDYTLLSEKTYNKTSRVITTRGCPNNCKFCGTNQTDTEFRIINNWKRHFMNGGNFAIIHDNSILAHGTKHFSEVINFFKNNKLKFMLDNFQKIYYQFRQCLFKWFWQIQIYQCE